MKRLFIFLTLTVAFSLYSCDFIDITNPKDDSLVTGPLVTDGTAELTIVPTQLEGVIYANIFRYETTGATNDAEIIEESLLNVGEILINPEYTGAYTFIDKYTDSSKNYQYFIRYKNQHNYIVSKTSSTHKGAGTNGEKSIVNTLGDPKLFIDLDKAQTILSFNITDIQLPDTNEEDVDFDVMLAVNNGVSTLLFKMTKDTKNEKYTISLRNLIPESFYDKNLTLSGVIGQTKSEVTRGSNNDEVIYTVFRWTKPLATQLLIENEEKDAFVVASSVDSASNIDYTPFD